MEQTPCIRIESEFSKYRKIQNRVRQGGIFSPDLFYLYRETILIELKVLPGIIIGGRNLDNIRYTDDTVLLADSKKTTRLPTEGVGKQEEQTNHHLQTD